MGEQEAQVSPRLARQQGFRTWIQDSGERIPGALAWIIMGSEVFAGAHSDAY